MDDDDAAAAVKSTVDESITGAVASEDEGIVGCWDNTINKFSWEDE